MLVQGVLDLDGGDVLATGNDDVLEPVLDLDIAVGMPHGQVAGVEPAATEGFGGGFRVFQVTLHHRVAAHEDFAQGIAVAGYWLKGLRVGDHQAVEGRVAHALARLDPCALFQRQFIPFVMPGTHGHRAVDFGQAVGVGDLDAHLFHGADDLGGWRGAGDHGLHRVLDGRLGRLGHVDQGVEHDRRAAQVADPVLADQGQDLLRVDPAQEHMGAGQRGDGPRVAPAVAVEHRQGPQVHRAMAHAPDHLVAQGVQVSATVVVDHALGVAGGAGGVVERDRLPLVIGPFPGKVRVAFGEERLIIQFADRTAFAVLRVIHIHHQWRVLEQGQGRLDDAVELAVGDQHLGLAMLQHEGDGLGVQAYVQGIEHGAGHGHAKMGFEHGRNVGQHHRHGVATADTPAHQGAGQASAALVGLLPVAADGTVDHRRVVAVYGSGAFDETQRGEGDMVDGSGHQALGIDRHAVIL
ncbi:hypothetical protein D3C79_526310 [compost metagenome]